MSSLSYAEEVVKKLPQTPPRILELHLRKILPLTMYFTCTHTLQGTIWLIEAIISIMISCKVTRVSCRHSQTIGVLAQW